MTHNDSRLTPFKISYPGLKTLSLLPENKETIILNFHHFLASKVKQEDETASATFLFILWFKVGEKKLCNFVDTG